MLPCQVGSLVPKPMLLSLWLHHNLMKLVVICSLPVALGCSSILTVGPSGFTKAVGGLGLRPDSWVALLRPWPPTDPSLVLARTISHPEIAIFSLQYVTQSSLYSQRTRSFITYTLPKLQAKSLHNPEHAYNISFLFFQVSGFFTGIQNYIE